MHGLRLPAAVQVVVGWLAWLVWPVSPASPFARGSVGGGLACPVWCGRCTGFAFVRRFD